MDSSGLELISKKLIKPSFSTSPPFKSYKLSFIDQTLPDMYMPLVFFYPNQNNTPSSLIRQPSNISYLLEKSLAKVLTLYYPFAGRLVDNLNVDLHEMGATFIEAHANCNMSQLSSLHVNAQDVIFPSGMSSRLKHDESLVVSQLTHFTCGWTTLSLCLYHKLCDALALCNFVRDWAAITKQGGDQKLSSSPMFNGASMFPPIEDASFKQKIGMLRESKQCVTKRYVFDPKKLRQLKIKASVDTCIQNPTRVEVVTALLNKCAIAATSMVHPNSCKPPTIIQAVNMRSLIEPPLSPDFVGNFLSSFLVAFPDSKDLSFSRLIIELRRAKVEFYDKFKGITAHKLHQELLNMARMIGDESRNFDAYYISTSFCRYPLYDIDFGWGKPQRIGFGAHPYENIFTLIDDPNGDGIEVFVSLEEKVMNVFETDPELLQFASFGSSLGDQTTKSVSRL